MSQTEVSIPTPDGHARAFVFKPQGQGPWPAVIFFMDGPGIRPALFTMSERLAGHGYYVLMPDMFWRLGPYEPTNLAEGDEVTRRARFATLMASTDPIRSMRDTAAFLDFLSAQPEVKGGRVGVTGYCMGGAMALRAAGHFPGRVVAAAAFHGGGLATDAPDSPHLLAPKIKAKVLVAAADRDPYLPSEQVERLRAALDDAGVDNQVVVYEGALHGYASPDTRAYDRDASERHWREMFALFDKMLKAQA
jgi:carboxymethylenebutenolidase